MFVRSGTSWTQQAKLTLGVRATNDYFGYSVSLSGDTVVVGAYLDDNAGGVDAGLACVFVRSGTNWTVQTSLAASDAAAGDYFGYSVSLSGDTVVVGADHDDHAGVIDAGSAYVFVRSGTGWTEQAKLTASDGQQRDHSAPSASRATRPWSGPRGTTRGPGCGLGLRLCPHRSDLDRASEAHRQRRRGRRPLRRFRHHFGRHGPDRGPSATSR